MINVNKLNSSNKLNSLNLLGEVREIIIRFSFKNSGAFKPLKVVLQSLLYSRKIII